MRKQLGAGLLVLALAVGAGGLLGVACSGGAGLGIATLGISTIFDAIGGSGSPGHTVRDAVFVEAAELEPEPEPNIQLPSGEAVERFVVLGGDLIDPVDVRFDAFLSNQGAEAELAVALEPQRADAMPSNPSPPFTKTVAVDSTEPQSFEVRFDELIPEGERFAGLSPGDILRIRFENQGPGDVEIATEQAGIDARVAMLRRQQLILAQVPNPDIPGDGSPYLRLDPAGLERLRVSPPPEGPSIGRPMAASFLLRATSDLGGLYDAAGADAQRTAIPDAIFYVYSGDADYRLRVREDGDQEGPTRFDMQLDYVSGGTTVRTFGRVEGLEARGDRFRALRGRFPGSARSIEMRSTPDDQPAQQLRLEITNHGPNALVLDFDEDDPDLRSLILPEGPDVFLSIGQNPFVRVTQPAVGQ